MGQDPLPRLAHLPHRRCRRGPLWRHMGVIIAPLPVLSLPAPWGPMLLFTGQPFPEREAGCEAQGAYQGGGPMGVIVLCSKTMEVHHENSFASAEPDRSMGTRGC